MSDKNDDGVTTFGRVAAGMAGIGLIVLLAFGWHPPAWLTARPLGIFFYFGIMFTMSWPAILSACRRLQSTSDSGCVFIGSL
jgi:hypothetical protein